MSAARIIVSRLADCFERCDAALAAYCAYSQARTSHVEGRFPLRSERDLDQALAPRIAAFESLVVGCWHALANQPALVPPEPPELLDSVDQKAHAIRLLRQWSVDTCPDQTTIGDVAKLVADCLSILDGIEKRDCSKLVNIKATFDSVEQSVAKLTRSATQAQMHYERLRRHDVARRLAKLRRIAGKHLKAIGEQREECLIRRARIVRRLVFEPHNESASYRRFVQDADAENTGLERIRVAKSDTGPTAKPAELNSNAVDATGNGDSPKAGFLGIIIDETQHAIGRGTESVSLAGTPMLYRVAAKLVSARGNFVSAQELAKLSATDEVQPASMKRHIGPLREILKPLNLSIENKPNVGYRLIAGPA